MRKALPHAVFGYGTSPKSPDFPNNFSPRLPIHWDLASIGPGCKHILIPPKWQKRFIMFKGNQGGFRNGRISIYVFAQTISGFERSNGPRSENTWGMAEANKLLHIIGRLVDCFFNDFCVFFVSCNSWGFLQTNTKKISSHRELAKMQLLHGLILGIGFLTRHLDLKSLAKNLMCTLSIMEGGYATLTLMGIPC